MCENCEMVPTDLAQGQLHAFGDWPTTSVPKGPPGVYTVWRGVEFLYVGISWREPSPTGGSTTKGLWGRLDSHAAGRRSGDQFCIYVCDRFVLVSLSPGDIQEVAAGALSLDGLTRDYIRTNLAYRYVTTASGKDARELETVIRRGGLLEQGQPLLNPLR